MWLIGLFILKMLLQNCFSLFESTFKNIGFILFYINALENELRNQPRLILYFRGPWIAFTPLNVQYDIFAKKALNLKFQSMAWCYISFEITRFSSFAPALIQIDILLIKKQSTGPTLKKFHGQTFLCNFKLKKIGQ